MVYGRRSLDEITDGIIHCADTPNGFAKYTVDSIEEWHAQKAQEGKISPRRPPFDEGTEQWANCAYNAVIHTDGKIVRVRALEETPSATGHKNPCSIAVCLIGRTAFTPAQWDSLSQYCDEVESALGRKIRWTGHRDHARRICPGFDVYSWFHVRNRHPLPQHVCKERPYGKRR